MQVLMVWLTYSVIETGYKMHLCFDSSVVVDRSVVMGAGDMNIVRKALGTPEVLTSHALNFNEE